MKKKHKIDILAGLTFSGITSVVIRFQGASKSSFILLSYSFIFMGLFLCLKNLYFEGDLPSVHDIVVVVDREEKVFRQVFSGKKYRLEGDFEKIDQ